MSPRWLARRRPGTSDPTNPPAKDPAMGSRLIFFSQDKPTLY
nr:MAG TPA: hypothetical protein [Caudoviricetes sp.]